MSRWTIALVIAVGFLFSSMTGCKKEVSQDAFCEHIKEVIGDEVTDEDCAEEFTKISERCSNPAEVLECVMAIEGEDGWDGCEDKCERIED